MCPWTAKSKAVARPPLPEPTTVTFMFDPLARLLTAPAGSPSCDRHRRDAWRDDEQWKEREAREEEDARERHDEGIREKGDERDDVEDISLHRQDRELGAERRSDRVREERGDVRVLLESVVREELVEVAANPDSDDTATMKAFVARMLEQLKHTPITGIGHNFEFRETNPVPGNLDLFTDSRQDLINNMPDCWEPATASLAASFKNNTDTVIVNIQRQYEADVLIVKFNFHHPIKSADDALVVLRGESDYKRMNQNLIFAKQLMTELYGEIEND